jgi:polyisoprenoid-binding protein YceI
LNIVRSFRSAAIVFALSITASVVSAQTSTWKVDADHSGIEFKIRHFGVSNVRGTMHLSKAAPAFVKLDEKDITKSSVEAVIDAASIDTRETARDGHLKSPDFFNVAQFPNLTFKSTSITRSEGKLLLTGELTLAGVTKPVTLTLDGPAAPQTDPKGVTRSGFSATGILKRTDFNFGSKYSPPLLGDGVEFTIDIEMDKQ